ncbi:MAG: O-methyltransferase [Candidatus Nanopelagicales bacterium]|nr:O-methyltransferase [Candidatus Nanopelagicales bacterium]MDZ4249601.1 O-methyltransferase [Candidatus Nanopelagicales bacterium]
MDSKPPTQLQADSLKFADSYISEDDPLLNARAQAELLGCVPIAAGSGALLRFVAQSIHARHVVEVGTGAGVSGLWLLRGMDEDGVLTSIDLEVDHQRVARDAFAAADIPPGRFRLIAGRAMEVLPRLTDSAYDMVLIDADKAEYGLYLDEALRLLRPGGVVALDNALWQGRVADPSQRDAETMGLREILNRIRADEALTPVLAPVGDGLLLAVVKG